MCFPIVLFVSFGDAPKAVVLLCLGQNARVTGGEAHRNSPTQPKSAWGLKLAFDSGMHTRQLLPNTTGGKLAKTRVTGVVETTRDQMLLVVQ